MTIHAGTLSEIVSKKDKLDIVINVQRVKLKKLVAEKQELIQELKKQIIERSAFELLTVDYSKIRPRRRARL